MARRRMPSVWRLARPESCTGGERGPGSGLHPRSAAAAASGQPERAREKTRRGAGQTLVARLRVGRVQARAPVPHPRGDRRLHTRVPGPGRRYLALGPARCSQARQADPAVRHACGHRQRQRHGADQPCDPRVAERHWGVRWHNIAPGKPTQNVDIERSMGRLRDKLLNLADARRKLAIWRYDHDDVRPHRARR